MFLFDHLGWLDSWPPWLATAFGYIFGFTFCLLMVGSFVFLLLNEISKEIDNHRHKGETNERA